MASDEDAMMLDEPAQLTSSSKDKGKGKVVDDKPARDLENLPWVEKYRPVHLSDVVSHADITSTIEKFIEKSRLPHLLFYGPPGTGKTSTIIAVARKIYGSDYKRQILELNASDDRGIDVVREQIKQFAETRTLFSKSFKLIVLDEADMMTQAAQMALRRVIEQYTKNVRFCIICNYVNKISPAIQSRCTRFRFSPLAQEHVRTRVEHVVESEKVNITPDGLTALLRLSRGDMRRALNVLQACHAAYDRTSEEEVYNCTGAPHPADIETVVESMMKQDITTAYERISKLRIERGIALQDMITGIYDFIYEVDFPVQSRVYLLDHLATAEYRLSTGGNEKMQFSGILAAFKMAVEMSDSAGKPVGQ
ncbi:P-loop containing nucleoside triphosphate hydrolase protein [Auriculariales sp. MPI-PUGE-AT-0066]|nr:P-loop containing nucleoside triphosphate hydrolase protein [Auriculariales sp. MPI-PUGE-AT-0066]